MKLKLHVDTNDYNEDLKVTDYSRGYDNYTPEWSLFNLCLKTFQDWKTSGQTGFWTVEGDTFCGTAYECDINYRGMDGELLLRCLIAKIKEVCGDRYINLWIDEIPVKFSNDDLVLMDPAWVKKMKE